ncbi:microcin C ABC transporter ATP-binding protein YejF [Raoultella planticola]|uniref:Microcin C ABC transporter ATP-binding protein YejF n=1 Tax=Raoultella planticola TaxID=575 RepID=A0A485ACL5_RAOPL|nr:microcin C ABC transporter ATP-binding protein YejF [Raoultella planticola]
MTQPLLEIDNLSIAFRQQGKTHTVVSELSLNIGRRGNPGAGGGIRLR